MQITNTKATFNHTKGGFFRPKPILSTVILFMVVLFSNHSATAVELSDLFDNDSDKTASAAKSFLPVTEAFTVVPIIQGNKLSVHFQITPKHYIYKDKVVLKLPNGVEASPFTFSQTPHTIDDPNFGKVAIFDQPTVIATATLTNTSAQPINQEVSLKWQGCAKAGLCYPPQRLPLMITLASTDSTRIDSSGTQTAVDNNLAPVQPNISTEKKIQAKEVVSKPNEIINPVLTAKPTPKTAIVNSSSMQSSTTTKLDNKTQSGIDKEEAKSLLTNTSPENAKNAAGETSVIALTDDTEGVKEIGILSNSEDKSNEAAGLSGTGSLSPINTSLVDSETASNNVVAQPLTADSVFDLDNSAVNQDPFGLGRHPILALGLLFLAGLGLAFTPCVLPMLPIVSNLIARQHNPTARKGLILSSSYAVGVASTYGILGALIAVFGQSLGIIGWLQNPVILLSFAAIFVLLALHMSDALTLRVPQRLTQKVHAMSQMGDKRLGSGVGSFVAGFLSALVVSPCVSAPLFGALLAVSTIGNPFLGFIALFMLGLGLSAPLILLGMSQGNFMPKAGEWMNWIKQGFALLLLSVALLLISRVFITSAMLIVWAVWGASVAGWLWTWRGRAHLFSQALAALLAVWSICWVIGAAAGSQNVWQPLQIFTSNGLGGSPSASIMPIVPANTMQTTTGSTIEEDQPDTSSKENSNYSNSAALIADATISSPHHITRMDELLPIINEHSKVLIDVTADWCIECHIIENTLFAKPPKELQDWQVVKLDVTKTNAASKEVLTTLHLFGPPALLYIVNGKVKQQHIGTIERKEFIETLRSL